MKLQRISNAEDGGVLITWSRTAVSTVLVWLGVGAKIGLTFLIMRILRAIVDSFR